MGKKDGQSHDDEIKNILNQLYDKGKADETWEKIGTLIEKYRSLLPVKDGPTHSLSQQDIVLITYPNQISESSRLPLSTLANVCNTYLTGLINTIHILPFYPSSSDDGFSVIDYTKVDTAYGTWDDIAALGARFRLMFDAVINHISSKSEWFQGFLKDDPRYSDYFIVVDKQTNLSQVVRPRALPLLTEVTTSSGRRSVWTTFSTDQIDLNYQNPTVLLEILDVVLFYISRSAEFIRLDAIAYLWKEIGTSCIHLPQTHAIVRLLRAIIDDLAPHVSLITETNVPHEENMTYFGDGSNEAHLIYNFALPPLVLHTIRSGSAVALTNWAMGLKLPTDKVTFFNFLASHDGIGLNPVRGILSIQEIDTMVNDTLACRGLVGYKDNPDGTKSPYELNINYFDALTVEKDDEADQMQIKRFITAHAIMLALVGVPGIYFHSLFGSRGWPEGVRQNGQNRAINRQKLLLGTLMNELRDANRRRFKIFRSFSRMIEARRGEAAFDPHGQQVVLDCGEPFFVIIRLAARREDDVLCIHNVTSQSQRLSLKQKEASNWISCDLLEIIGCENIRIDGQTGIALRPYQNLWLMHTS